MCSGKVADCCPFLTFVFFLLRSYYPSFFFTLFSIAKPWSNAKWSLRLYEPRFMSYRYINTKHSSTYESNWTKLMSHTEPSPWKPKQGGCFTLNSFWGQGLHLIQYNFHCRSIAHYFNCTEVIDTLNVFNMALAWNFIFQNHHGTVCMALMVKSLFLIADHFFGLFAVCTNICLCCMTF